MVKLFSVHFSGRTLQLFAVETLLLFGALLVPVLLHFGNSPSDALIADYRVWKIAAVAAICLLFLYCNNLYSPSWVKERNQALSKFLQSLGAAALVLGLLYSIFPGMQLYRGFSITSVSLAALLLISNRAAFVARQEATQESKPIIILGDGSMARFILRAIQYRTDLGFQVAGYVGGVWKSAVDVETPRRLGSIDELASIVEKIKPAQVVVAMAERRSSLPVDELLVLKTSGVSVRDGVEFYEHLTGKLAVELMRPSSLIFSSGFQVTRLAARCRRIISFLLAGTGLLVSLPLLALIALAIRLDSPGPIIFRQRRVGYRGEHFTLYKFRTMEVDADRGGYARPAEHNDPRVTRVGRLLRRLRLDEIPQMFNILMGHMHFVGPRPFVPEQEMDCAAQIPLYKFRWSVRPGATGWAQVQRGYCASLQDNTDKLAYDLFYIKNRSVSLDLLILLKTIRIVLSAQGGR